MVLPLGFNEKFIRASSVLSYSLRQLTQNLFFINADRNVSVDSQRGQFVNLGFVSTVKNIVNSLMVFIFMVLLVVQIVFHMFPYRYNGSISKGEVY